MSTATKIKTLSGYKGSAALYQLDPPFIGENQMRDDVVTEFVVVSATDIDRSDSEGAFLNRLAVLFGGPDLSDRTEETMVFEADADGDVVVWYSLADIGHKSHADALGELGYEVAE